MVGCLLAAPINFGSDYKGGNLVSPSDRRLKKDITYLNSQDILQKVINLKGATYHWIDEAKGKTLKYDFIAL